MENTEQNNMKGKKQTDSQRRYLFTLLKERAIDKEKIESAAGDAISNWDMLDMSRVLDILKNTESKDACIFEVGKVFTEKPPEAKKSEQKTIEPEKDQKAKEQVIEPEHVKQEYPVQDEGGIDSITIGGMTISASNIAKLKRIPKMLNDIFHNVMQEGTDYGTIPGTQKPALLKPGAEMLKSAFSLELSTEVTPVVEDWQKGFFYYKAETVLMRDGKFVAKVGVGSANSEETRYSSRWVFESDIPQGTDINSLKSKTRISKNGKEYKVYLVEPSISEKATLVNTLQKMAKKRSFVDAVLLVTGASRIFTQDVEDMKGATE